jgi:hypothetical protein
MGERDGTGVKSKLSHPMAAPEMAAPERLELPTVSFEGCRSIQLSYGAALMKSKSTHVKSVNFIPAYAARV